MGGGLATQTSEIPTTFWCPVIHYNSSQDSGKQYTNAYYKGHVSGRGLRDPQGKDWRVPTAQLHGVSEESGPPHSARTLMSKELPMGVSVQKHDWQTHHVLTELSSRISIPILSLEVYLISLSMRYNYLITSLVLPAWSAPIQRWSRSSSIIYKWSHLISKSQAPVPGTNHDKDTLFT